MLGVFRVLYNPLRINAQVKLFRLGFPTRTDFEVGVSGGLVCLSRCELRIRRGESGRVGIEKKEEIWLSPVTKPPTPTEQSKKQRDNIKTPPKTLITQLLPTDLGRSVGVTAVTQLVRLDRFTSVQPSHLPQQPCNQMDTHLKNCK